MDEAGLNRRTSFVGSVEKEKPSTEELISSVVAKIKV